MRGGAEQPSTREGEHHAWRRGDIEGERRQGGDWREGKG